MQTTIKTAMSHRVARAASVTSATTVHDAAQCLVAELLEALLVVEAISWSGSWPSDSQSHEGRARELEQRTLHPGRYRRIPFG